MASLKDIRQRITSIKTTQQTTKAMKMVSASKLKRAQDSMMKVRPYASKLNQLLGNLTASLENADFESPYMTVRERQNILFVVVTSNRGLCGAFNSNVVKLAAERINSPEFKPYLDAGKLQVLCVGKKAYEYFSKRNYPVLQDQNFDVFAKLSFETVDEVADMVMKGYTDGRWDFVEIFYNEFVNVATQVRTNVPFLPITLAEAAASVTDKKKKKNETTTEAANVKIEYIFEPDRNQLLQDLIPKILKIKFFRTILESNASEHAARMVAMDAANENAETILKDLRLQYNKARQAAITKEILEIVGGAEALSGK